MRCGDELELISSSEEYHSLKVMPEHDITFNLGYRSARSVLLRVSLGIILILQSNLAQV